MRTPRLASGISLFVPKTGRGSSEATAMWGAFHQHREFEAAVELSRLFPGVTDNRRARECARMIAGWQPITVRPDHRSL